MQPTTGGGDQKAKGRGYRGKIGDYHTTMLTDHPLIAPDNLILSRKKEREEKAQDAFYLLIFFLFSQLVSSPVFYIQF